MKQWLLVFLTAGALTAAESPRIFIVTDMEGVGGVNSWDEQTTPGQRRFEESRRLLTGEVNAAIEGAFDSGAGEVVVWDGHDGSRSLSIDEIDPRARLIQGKSTPASYYFEPKRYDGIIFIGQHAMAGTANGLLAHSQSRSILRITINGKPVGEIGQTAAIGGHFKIPVIMLSGDQAACDEMLDIQPKAETVAVKRMAGKDSSDSLSHKEATARIRMHAGRAVSRIEEFAPWVIEGPVEMSFEFYPETSPNGEAKQRPPRIYRGSTVLEAFEQWLGK
jgi:D-amino peptidase